jgi:membrane fusion protein (multidrug efflux system)
VSGFVNRKSVNPGDHVQVGQALISIQPLESVYIVANFKETQLSEIVIGQPVEI